MLTIVHGNAHRRTSWRSRALPAELTAGELAARAALSARFLAKTRFFVRMRVLGLLHESLGRVVLRPGVGVQRAVVDAIEIGGRALRATARMPRSTSPLRRCVGVVCSVVGGVARLLGGFGGSAGGCGLRARASALGRRGLGRRRRRTRTRRRVARRLVGERHRRRRVGVRPARRRAAAAPACRAAARPATVFGAARAKQPDGSQRSTAASASERDAPRARSARRRASRISLSVLFSRLRQQDSERRARPWSRLYLNLAVVHLHGAIHHRQADAAALLLRREIQIEDPLQMLGLDADAGVGRTTIATRRPRAGFAADPQRAAVAASPDRRSARDSETPAAASPDRR